VTILGAGRSRRMGRPKLLLPWGDTSVVGLLLRQWQSIEPAQIAMVAAVDDRDLASELDRLGFPVDDRIFNPDPDRGMFSSIQCAARWPGWREELSHWVVTLGDQPHLRAETLRALRDFAAAHPDKICRPLRSGRPKHPVLLPRKIFFELQNAEVPDLKTFLTARAAECAGIESTDPGLDLDMDTPEDYERLRP